MSSYPTQTPNLGKLNFEEIKTSLKEYLQSQESLKDYNFEGSVLQTLMNVLAYNTYYYAFYANMVSNEMFLDSAQRTDSVVSLTKPLGYFIPLKTCSKAVLNVFGLTSNIPEYAQFRGINSDGVIYSFYTTRAYTPVDSDALNVEIFEAKNLIKNNDVTNSFDGDLQRFFINDPNIDTNTLKVKIKRNGQSTPSNPSEQWIMVDNFGSTTFANQNIYYLERTNNGVYVLFGKVNSLGNSVNALADSILIDYLSTSGSIANQIQEFNLINPTPSSLGTNVNIGLVSESMGGLDSPNLDLVKFAAPRTFGAQNRAVTKDDFRGIISSFFNSPDDFSVFGGDEIFPTMFGRIFFTADLNPNVPGDLVKINQIYDVLKQKCIVTLLPEFTVSRSLQITSRVTFSLLSTGGSSSLTAADVAAGIKTLLQTKYDSAGKYNFYFNAGTAVDEIKRLYQTVVIDISDFTFSYSDTFTTQPQILLNFENEIDIPYFVNYDITNVFVDKFGRSVKLAVYITPSQNKFEFVRLRVLVLQTNGSFIETPEFYGRINIKRGIIEINDIIGAGSFMNLFLTFKNSYFKSSLNNKIKFTTTNVELK